MKVAQSCPAFCNSMDYTVRGILQGRILEWVAFPFSRESSQPRDRTGVPCIAGRFFTNWAMKEARKPEGIAKFPSAEEGISYPLQYSWASLVAQESACNMGDLGSLPGLGRSPGEGISYPLQYSWASLVAQLVKNLPTMKETWVWSLGWEDALEKGKATHSSILAWRIPQTV